MTFYPIGVYEKSLYVKELKYMLEDAARIGFDLFELSIDETNHRMERLKWTQEQRQKLVKQAGDVGIPLYSICFSAHRKYPMGSADKEIERKSMEMMRQAIRLSCDLGIRVIQMAGYDVFYEPHTLDTARRFEENLEKSVELAANAGVMLAVETVENHITSVKKAMELVEKIQSPWFGIYPDTANLYMTDCSVPEELQMGKGHMTAVHVREAPDEMYIPYGQGKLDFDRIFQVLKEAKFHGPVVVELWNQTNPEYEKILGEAITFLRGKMGL